MHTTKMTCSKESTQHSRTSQHVWSPFRQNFVHHLDHQNRWWCKCCGPVHLQLFCHYVCRKGRFSRRFRSFSGQHGRTVSSAWGCLGVLGSLSGAHGPVWVSWAACLERPGACRGGRSGAPGPVWASWAACLERPGACRGGRSGAPGPVWATWATCLERLGWPGQPVCRAWACLGSLGGWERPNLREGSLDMNFRSKSPKISERP